MVERWAMVRDDGYVENVCLWDGNLSNWAPPAGITMIRALEDVSVGWTFNGEWGPPEIPPDPLLSA